MVIQALALLASTFSFFSIFPQILAMLKSDKKTDFPLLLKIIYFIIPLSWLIWSIKESSYLPLFASILNLILASIYLLKVKLSASSFFGFVSILLAGIMLYFLPVFWQEALTAILSILMVLAAIREIDKVEEDISSLKYFLEGIEELVWCGWAFLSAVPLIGISSVFYGPILIFFSYKIHKKSNSIGYFNRLLIIWYGISIKLSSIAEGMLLVKQKYFTRLSMHLNMVNSLVVHQDIFFYIED
jgi:hypothetical protein